MRGALVGTLALIVGYTVVTAAESRGVDRLGSAGGVVVGGLRRLISSGVAGIPQRKGAGGSTSGPQSGSGSGSGGGGGGSW